MKFSLKSALCIVLPVLVALVSFFALAGPMSSPETHKDTIAYLEDRRTVVLELTGASTAASVAITLLPGDTGTPIAEKLADLSSSFLVIMSALVLEKYLVTLTGLVVFKFLIPLACALLVLFFLYPREVFLRSALRLLAFGMALFFLVPVSVHVSQFIESTYQDLQIAVDSALEQDQTDLLEDASESSVPAESSSAVQSSAAAPASVSTNTGAATSSEDATPGVAASAAESGTASETSAAQNNAESRAWWQRALDLLSGRVEEAGSAVQQQIDRIKEDVEGIAEQVTVAPEKLSRLLNHYIEVVSVLIVTSCVIPLLVFLVFWYLIKMLFGLDMPSLSSLLRGKGGGA